MTTIATPQRKPARVGLVIVGVLATAIALASIGTYASASLDTLAEGDSPISATYAAAHVGIQLALYAHVVGGSIALLVGPFQFSKRLRKRFTRAHRVVGRVYVFAVLISAAAGLAIAPSNSAGAVGTLGFGLLALAWAGTVIPAWKTAVNRDLRAHRAWMIRNYSLTFAAVTLRLWLPILIGVQAGLGQDDPDASFAAAYAWVPFLCWVPNLIVAEWLVRRRGLPSLLPGGRSRTAAAAS